MGKKCTPHSDTPVVEVSTSTCFVTTVVSTKQLNADCSISTSVDRSIVSTGKCGTPAGLVVSGTQPRGTSAPVTTVARGTAIPLPVAVSVTTIGGVGVTDIPIPGVTGGYSLVSDIKVFSDNQTKVFKEGPLRLLVNKTSIVATKNGGKTYILCSDAKPKAGSCSSKANTYEFSVDFLIIEGTTTGNSFDSAAKKKKDSKKKGTKEPTSEPTSNSSSGLGGGTFTQLINSIINP